MRIISMHLMKWAEDNSLFLSSVDDLSFVGWLQRSFFREGVRFGARTACNRSKVGEPLSLNLPESQAKCYIYVNKDKLAALVIADDQYPERVAFMIVSKLLKEFQQKYTLQKVNDIKKDEELPFPQLQQYIKLYQDPKQVDKLQKLKSNLDQLKGIVHKNLDDIIDRGKNLDELMQKSKDVSNMSLQFYKTAKKVNTRCCSLY